MGSRSEAVRLDFCRPYEILRGVDELETRLRRRDARFLWRVGIFTGAALLVGALVMAWVVDSHLGGCVARGFQTITGG